MRNGGGFRVIAALLLLGFIGLITAGAYGAGFAAGSASTATTVPAWAYGGAFGFGHVLGFLLAILILIVLFRLIALAFFGHRHRAWSHRGYWAADGDAGRGGPDSWNGGPSGWQGGPGSWHGGWRRSEWREAGQAAFDDFHRRAHGTEPPAAGGPSAGPTAASGPTAGPSAGPTAGTSTDTQPR
jgi:hypothetical protein